MCYRHLPPQTDTRPTTDCATKLPIYHIFNKRFLLLFRLFFTQPTKNTQLPTFIFFTSIDDRISLRNYNRQSATLYLPPQKIPDGFTGTIFRTQEYGVPPHLSQIPRTLMASRVRFFAPTHKKSRKRLLQPAHNHHHIHGYDFSYPRVWGDRPTYLKYHAP